MAYSSITKPGDYFNTKLYTGNGSTQSITGVGFQPDWVWIKNRDQADNHMLYDSVRGATKRVITNTNGAEATDSNGVTSFDSDGFSIGDKGAINTNTESFASWNWLAGGTASSNSDGSITSNVSVNSTSGFSIVTYTGTGSTASVGHGLGAKPDLIISKIRSTTGDWNVYHDSFAVNERIKLNSTGAKNTNTSIFSSLPTSSVVNIGTGGDINTSGGTHLFYCFKSIKGFSKFGTYTGNGNTDGTFVYTGFKPAFILYRNTSTSENWEIADTQRSPTNLDDKRIIYVNQNIAGVSTTRFDFLSNGFKARSSNTAINASGNTYIYMVFAEHPLVANVSGGLPATAR